MIQLDEITIENMNEFWDIHLKYLVDDQIITDSEDIAYFVSDEYRNLIRDHMIRDQDKHHMTYFIESGKRIGATQYNTYQSEDGKCFILDFWVFPEFRGKGTGHRCFKALKEYTKEDGAVYYELNCSNDRSRDFWSNMGFEDNGIDEYGVKLMILK